ncbi:MAG: preprotein translocase subunit SecY [Eubacteriales bacterium]|jgi:preprotein translocase subunit SecY|nr:preprotein translocase subunit SecY [Eubacteriales bacterium]MDD3571765.1 preprotein translocase subunit SecY [Eubacteriales bacterium]MDD4134321.1 preprotein translocase subunit SecY [Eubacteriales bacterium]
MWDTLRNAWKVPELRKKILYTFMMLLIYRLVSVVPVPGINASVVQEVAGAYDMLGLVNMMTGNAFSQMTVMAMGITPYINASIIIQLLTVAIPALERLQKEGGEEGKEKLNKITRYSTVVLAAIQAIGIIAALNSGTTTGGERVLQPGYDGTFGLLSIGVVMASGTAFAMWIGERVTQKGIGNGISLLIFAGIISNLFSGILTAFTDVLGITQYGGTVSGFLILIVTALVIITVVTFVDLGERRIPVQYAKRVVGRKMYGGQSTHIPMKIVSVGVLPLIFAYSFMAFPGTIIAMFGPDSGASKWWNAYMHQSAPLNLAVTALLIIAFTYFYASISFNPQDISKNIQQQGGNIPGIRSGQNTISFLSRISKRLTLFAAIFLAALATLPTLLSVWQNVQIPFAASSMLIAVSVSLETVRQVEAQLVMRNYKGFL